MNERLSAAERADVADLAFSLGRRYQDRSLADLSAAADQWRAVCAAGLAAVSLPAQAGGGGTLADLLLVAERLGAGGYPAGKLTLSTAIAATVLDRHGDPEQRRRWLPGIADGSVRFSFALTEPEAGSNARRISTTATHTGNGWRLAGTKTYISAADDSDVMLVAARDAASGGLSLVAVPLPDERIGLTPVPVTVPVPERQWTVHLDDVEVPDGSLVGPAGGASRALFDALNPERLIVAAQAVGVGRWCLARAAAYASERVVFDVPIGAHQAVAHPLAEALVDLEAAWALVERGVERYERGEDAGQACAMAKVKACDAALAAADRALQTFGGSGFTAETLMFERFGYLRLLSVAPVTRELALNHIAVAGLGLPRSY